MLKTSKTIKGVTFQVAQGDLTNEQVDAIVNAANGKLAHGAGVAGAIAKKGGLAIQQESDKFIKINGKIPVGQVGVTSAGKLKCRFIIHAVGPVFKGNLAEASEKLKNAVLNSYLKAEEMSIKSIALPAISSGIFGFPKEECARVMIRTTLEFFNGQRRGLELVRFVNFDSLTANIFARELDRVMSSEEHLGEVEEVKEMISSFKLEEISENFGGEEGKKKDLEQGRKNDVSGSWKKDGKREGVRGIKNRK